MDRVIRERVLVGLLALLLIVSIGVGLLQAFRPMGEQQFAGLRDAVAVVNLFGMISGPQTESVFGAVGGSDSVVNAIEWARKEPRARAVVLRINSPGGTVGATQEIHAAVKRLKASGKPVVVSVTEMCASGGYYVACPADVIMANPGAMVGSIGVILYAPNLRGLLEDKLGVRFNVITSGKWKDTGSPFRDMTAEERERLQKRVDVVYRQFLDAVIEARTGTAAAGAVPAGQERAAVERSIRESAEGQVFTAVEAKERYLIDQIGPYHKALDVARRLGKLPADAPVITCTRSPSRLLLDALGARSASPVAQYLHKLEIGPRLEYRYAPGI